MEKVLVLVGSSRPGTRSGLIAEWFKTQTAKRSDLTFEFVDVASLQLPLYNEPEHPLTGNYKHEYTKAWSKQVATADAFVIITPEYNHGYPAVLKNALDYLFHEWRHKPIGFVGYGSNGGVRAVEQLRQVVCNLQMVPVSTISHVGFNIFRQINEQGELEPTPYNEAAATEMLDELKWWTTPLKQARQNSSA